MFLKCCSIKCKRFCKNISIHFFRKNHKHSPLLKLNQNRQYRDNSTLRDKGKKKAILTSVKFDARAQRGQHFARGKIASLPCHTQYIFQHLHKRCFWKPAERFAKNMHVQLSFYCNKKKDTKSTACDKDSTFCLSRQSINLLYIVYSSLDFDSSKFSSIAFAASAISYEVIGNTSCSGLNFQIDIRFERFCWLPPLPSRKLDAGMQLRSVIPTHQKFLC